MLSANLNRMFFLYPSASKTNIKNAIEQNFGVNVTSVNTLIQKPKAKRDRIAMIKKRFYLHWPKKLSLR